jgi:hypothetical protein
MSEPNISLTPVELLAAPLSGFIENWIEVKCCGETAIIPVKLLLKRCGDRTNRKHRQSAKMQGMRQGAGRGLSQ